MMRMWANKWLNRQIDRWMNWMFLHSSSGEQTSLHNSLCFRSSFGPYRYVFNPQFCILAQKDTDRGSMQTKHVTEVQVSVISQLNLQLLCNNLFYNLFCFQHLLLFFFIHVPFDFFNNFKYEVHFFKGLKRFFNHYIFQMLS